MESSTSHAQKRKGRFQLGNKSYKAKVLDINADCNMIPSSSSSLPLAQLPMALNPGQPMPAALLPTTKSQSSEFSPGSSNALPNEPIVIGAVHEEGNVDLDFCLPVVNLSPRIALMLALVLSQ